MDLDERILARREKLKGTIWHEYRGAPDTFSLTAFVVSAERLSLPDCHGGPVSEGEDGYLYDFEPLTKSALVEILENPSVKHVVPYRRDVTA